MELVTASKLREREQRFSPLLKVQISFAHRITSGLRRQLSKYICCCKPFSNYGRHSSMFDNEVQPNNNP